MFINKHFISQSTETFLLLYYPAVSCIEIADSFHNILVLNPFSLLLNLILTLTRMLSWIVGVSGRVMVDPLAK